MNAKANVVGRTVLTTTTPQQVREQPRVKAFLDMKKADSKGTATAYAQGLAKFQEFLNINNYGFTLNDISPTFFEQNHHDAYKLLDAFKQYLIEACGLSRSTIHNHDAAVRSYFGYYDIEISQIKYKNKVRKIKNYRSQGTAINDNDIRKILLACNSFKLKVYLLLLASGGFRAIEAAGLRLKDIDFSVTPTKVHVSEETAKTGVARDVYISEEATTYLKQFIDEKYNVPVQYKDGKTGEYVSFLRTRNENDLVFQMVQKDEENRLSSIYNKLMLRFQRLLKSTGLDQRNEKGKVKRRIITFHAFRRHVKTVVSDQTNTDFSEWFLGHASQSTYYRKKEPERRLMYATRCMPFLTYLSYSKLEQDATIKQTEVEMLMMKDANKDREIELLKQRLQVKEREVEMLKERNIMSTDALAALTDRVANLEKEKR